MLDSWYSGSTWQCHSVGRSSLNVYDKLKLAIRFILHGFIKHKSG